MCNSFCRSVFFCLVEIVLNILSIAPVLLFNIVPPIWLAYCSGRNCTVIAVVTIITSLYLYITYTLVGLNLSNSLLTSSVLSIGYGLLYLAIFKLLNLFFTPPFILVVIFYESAVIFVCIGIIQTTMPWFDSAIRKIREAGR